MPVVTPNEFASPDPLDRKYELGDELGRGGVGRVHLAKDRILGRDVAVKFLHERHVADDSVRERFVEEAQIGGQLQHPGIVPVYDLGKHGDDLFFAMKLVEGETLASQLERRSDPSDEPHHFLSVFESICQTIAFAHARGVVHRDLKPENVMIGAFGEVQVVDWGLGKLLDASEPAYEGQSRPTEPAPLRTARSEGSGLRSEAGTTIGTPAYMPREQALGDVARTDKRSDVFSLGAILCEILTGAPPYTGTTEEVVMQAAMAKLDNAHARLADSDAEPVLIALATECLQTESDDRPRDASVLAERVRAHLEQVEKRVQDTRVAAARSEVKARALKRMIALGAALLVVFAAGLVTSWWYWQEAERATAKERIAKAAVDRELERSEEIRSLVTAMLDQVTPERARTADTELLQGVLDEAAGRLRSGGITDPVVAGELHFLVGRVYKSIGEFPRAQFHLEQASELRRQSLGESDSRTLGTLMTLSEVLWRSGQTQAGEQLHERLESDFERLLGSDDPNTLTVKLHRAIAATASARYSEAEQRFVAIRENLREKFGEDHEYWAHMQSSMSEVLAQTDRLELAQQLGERALEAQLARHGETHPDVLAIRSNLAQIRLLNGDPAGAIVILEDCLRVDTQVLGPRHPSALITLNALTNAYEDDRQLERALTTADLVIERGDLEDQTAPALLDAMHNRMLILAKLDRLAEAIQQGEQLVAGREEVHGPDYDETLGARTDYGGLLNASGDSKTAASVLEPTFQRSVDALGPQHPFTQTAFEHLVAAYLALNRRPEAERLVRGFRRDMLDHPEAPPRLLMQGALGIIEDPDSPQEDLMAAAGYAERAAGVLEGEARRQALELVERAKSRADSVGK